MYGYDPGGTTPRNDAPGNAAYQRMRSMLAQVTDAERRGGR